MAVADEYGVAEGDEIVGFAFELANFIVSFSQHCELPKALGANDDADHFTFH